MKKEPGKKKRSTAYAWPLYAGVATLTAVHVAMETAQFLAENGIGGWLGTIASVAIGFYVVVLAGIFGIDLYTEAADS